MIIDKSLEFSVAQAVTTDAASTNVIDLGADRDLGASDLYLETLVTTAFDSANDTATLVIQLQTDSAENFASPTLLAASATLGVSSLGAKARPFRIKIPHTTERYLRLNYDNGTEAFSAGAISAWLTDNRDAWRAYDAVTGV